MAPVPRLTPTAHVPQAPSPSCQWEVEGRLWEGRLGESFPQLPPFLGFSHLCEQLFQTAIVCTHFPAVTLVASNQSVSGSRTSPAHYV